MKKIGIMLVIMVAGFSVMAQEYEEVNPRQEMKTLFGGKGQMTHGGYGGLAFGYTKIDGDDAFLAGVRGAWIINHGVAIGIGGYGFFNDINIDDGSDELKYNLAGGYGGLLVEPIIFPEYPVHVTIPILIGAGGISYYVHNYNCDHYNYDDWCARSIDSDAFFVVEPGIELELNVVPFLRIALGGTYRYTSDINIIDYENDILRGFNGYFTLKFGKF